MTTAAAPLAPSGARPDRTDRRAGMSGASSASTGPTLRIGDLAARAGVSVDALRYYERRGLVRPAGRRASGYREYPPDAAVLVRFIKRLQALGFTLAEVEELVRLRADARRPAAVLAARAVAAAKVRDIDDRVRQLLALRGALAELVDACESTCGADGPLNDAGCPIISPLDAASLDDENVTPAQAGTLLGTHESAVPTAIPTFARGDHDAER